MDGRLFDTITRLVAADVSRRGVIRGTLATLAGSLLGAAPAVSGRTRATVAAAESAEQYDPAAFIGILAAALPEFALGTTTFVFDPQHEAAAGAFYGAAPPAGWLGLLRTVLLAPDSNAVNGKGFNQALYLNGHWFDTDANAREWYLTGKPLLEASGNGHYFERTGEADFGIQRTLWWARFPTPEDPNVTIHRSIAWFRRGNVVLNVMLDLSCPTSTATTGAARKQRTQSGWAESCELDPEVETQVTFPLLMDGGLRAARTAQMVTRLLPLLVGTSVVNLDVTLAGEQNIAKFGQTAEEQAQRKEFGLGAAGHVTENYIGVDVDGTPIYVFANQWYPRSRDEVRELADALGAYVENSDARLGIERTEFTIDTAGSDLVKLTASAFTIPQEDGTVLGGFELRGSYDDVLATVGVIEATPLPPETTPEDVAEAKPLPPRQDDRNVLALFFRFMMMGYDAFGGGPGMTNVLTGVTWPPDPDEEIPEADPDEADAAEGSEPPSPVGTPVDLDEA